jgi:transcriptional regulator with XRE-family HTH domain|nr:MAG TPA: helix-turn-helix domain protein [Caudoviricetes sp.]
MSFAQNLKYIKEKENLTNYRLAKLFGCSQSSLINWLDNGVVPHPKTRQKIADHFGITLAELDGDDLPVLPKKGAEKAPDPKIEGVDDKIVQFIRSASAEELTEILRYIDFLESKRKKP